MRRVGQAHIADSAVVCGDVVCGDDVNIWYGCVVRGDVARITLSDRVNLQDGVIVHCDFDVPLLVEADVVVGHMAMLHGARIGRGSLIGIGAKLLTESDIGEESIIAAGSVVAPGAKIPPRSLVMGIPGKVVRTVRVDEIERTQMICERYRRLAREHADGKYSPFTG